MSDFCALCTSEDGPFVTRPLGRGNALVRVCAGCDDNSRPVTPRGRDAQRDYEMGPRKKLKAARVIHPHYKPRPPGGSRVFAHKREAGWELIRIGRLDDKGQPRDMAAAVELATHRQALAKFYAMTITDYVFQVPPHVDLGAGANDNPLGAIEHLRSKP